jgi:hypothetical protein
MGFEGSFWDYKEPKRNTERIPRLKENIQKLAGHSGLLISAVKITGILDAYLDR